MITPVVAARTLTAQVQGAFDTRTGEFHASSTSLAGTGLLRRVTGHLDLSGTEGADGVFTERITGRLCLPVPG